MHFASHDAYKLLVDDHLSPALRTRGFKGSAGRYELPTISHWSLVELQKSQFSDRTHLTFTANLFVVRRDQWQQKSRRVSIFGLTPRPGHIRDLSDQTRLGMLASPDDVDDWYGLSQDTDVGVLAKALLADLDEFGIPWLKAMASSR